MKTYPFSVVQLDGGTCSLARLDSGEKALLVSGDARGFEVRGLTAEGAALCPCTPANAAALRSRLPWLAPAPLGLRASIGLGDRLGLATPGHARAVAGSGIAPVFAQQSVRENVRTGRTPQQVIDNATWGVFQAGWTAQWGADADHLKHLEDLPAFLDAGYTFFTIDPGEHVQPLDPTETRDSLRARLDPADLAELRAAYLGRTYNLESAGLSFDEITLLRAAVKYGGAVRHAITLYRRLERAFGGKPFDFELSVDETDSATTPLEHIFIAGELARSGVRCTSLAPRFVGTFEKGVDYIGDLGEFEEQFGLHAAVARIFGGYKLSLHSGSDKFSIYPAAAQHSRGHIHLKTAGTSYLEALRTAARQAPDLFRRIYILSRARYETDRASYHVSAQLEHAPGPEVLLDAGLPALLDQDDAREILHVTFGAILAEFGAELRAFLDAHEEAYYAALQAHFARHLREFRGQNEG
jgi:hypothetical protein